MKGYEVFLSPLAEFKLDKILEYIGKNWGISSKNKFLNKLEIEIERLSEYPESSPASQIKKDIRKSVITSQTSLYYRIHNQTVEIITIIDNRQNPERTAEEIKRIFQ